MQNRFGLRPNAYKKIMKFLQANTALQIFRNDNSEQQNWKEKKMKLVMQTTSENCGQACIAMITGKNIEEVMKDMKTSGPTSIGQLIEILDFYGVKHAQKNTRISKKNPAPYKYSILTVHTNAGYTHWTLLYDNKYYDPEFGLIDGEYTYGKITSFLGIEQETEG